MIVISTDKNKLEVDVIHQFLSDSYWGKGRSLEEVKKSIEHCLCFGIYLEGKQIGFARVVTDYTIFAYIMDVFVLPDYRGNGYSKRLMNFINTYKDLQACSTWMLKTADAHGLYKQFGFSSLSKPNDVMERLLKK